MEPKHIGRKISLTCIQDRSSSIEVSSDQLARTLNFVKVAIQSVQGTLVISTESTQLSARRGFPSSNRKSLRAVSAVK